MQWGPMWWDPMRWDPMWWDPPLLIQIPSLSLALGGGGGFAEFVVVLQVRHSLENTLPGLGYR
jgi:hypothetical protein